MINRTCSGFASILAITMALPAYAQPRVLPEGVHAGYGFENGAHDTVGPYKHRMFLEFIDQLQLGERIKIDGELSGEIEELQGISAIYEQPFGKSGFKLTLRGSYNNTRPGGFIADFYDQTTRQSIGGGTALGSTLSYTYVPNPDVTVIFSGGFQAVDSDTEQISKFPAFFLPDFHFEQRTRDLQGSIAFNWNISKDLGVFSAFALEQGIDVLDPIASRADVDNTPTIFRYSGQVTQNLPNRFQLVLRGDLQATADRLNRLKLFSLGGWSYASAYRPGERLGDIGGGARLELNRVEAFSLLQRPKDTIYLKPFVFIDGGFTKFNDPIGDESTEVEKKASAGVGLSFEAVSGLYGGIQVSGPLSGATIFDDQNEEARFEPHRVCRRLRLLRDWSHDTSIEVPEVRTRGA